MKERMSNFELLRIICMLGIISLHFVSQGEFYRTDNLALCVMLHIISSFGRMACSVFIMISAYFNVDKRCSFKRIFMIWLAAFMYTVSITLVSKFIFHLPVEQEDFINAFFPINNAPLWFVSVYLLLLLLSPVLNVAINNCKKGMLEVFLLVFGIMLFGKPTLFAEANFLSEDLIAFIYIWIFIGYMKRYPIKLLEKKIFTGPVSVLLYLFVSTALGVLIYIYGFDYTKKGITLLTCYKNIFYTLPNFLIALLIFCFFKNLNVRPNKWINRIGKTTFGIYIIHQTPVFWKCIWIDILFRNYINESEQYLSAIIFAIISTFIVCMIIEDIRLHTIDRIIGKSRIVNKISNIVDGICEKC